MCHVARPLRGEGTSRPSGGELWVGELLLYTLARRWACRVLLVNAYQSATAPTFSMPRTVSCRRSQLRQRAWMHSQIERDLYCTLPASLFIRARQANTPAPSSRRG